MVNIIETQSACATCWFPIFNFCFKYVCFSIFNVTCQKLPCFWPPVSYCFNAISHSFGIGYLPVSIVSQIVHLGLFNKNFLQRQWGYSILNLINFNSKSLQISVMDFKSSVLVKTVLERKIIASFIFPNNSQIPLMQPVYFVIYCSIMKHPHKRAVVKLGFNNVFIKTLNLSLHKYFDIRARACSF